jgi:GNAT superfamily N-acetyltransferase
MLSLPSMPGAARYPIKCRQWRTFTTSLESSSQAVIHFMGLRKHMEKELNIVYIEKPEEGAWGIIGRGVSSYNIQQAGDNQFQRLCFVLQGDNNEILGGVISEVYWEWLYIDLLWVKEELRGRGYGRQLMETVEKKARQQGAKNAYLDTFSFQAPGFYERLGYKSFGELPAFPPGHERFFMKKEL